MNILLVAVNAKYIHSNLAVYSLKAFAEKELCSRHGDNVNVNIEIAEYTVNQQTEAILGHIYRKDPEVLCFSCYIWNIAYVKEIIRELYKVLPSCHIWAGGPEVSYNSREFLVCQPSVKGVMKGEGELTFAEICHIYACGGSEEKFSAAPGITFRNKKGVIVENPCRSPIDMDRIPFIYEDIERSRNRIIYYESSRGCPFSCSYCLSSIDKKLRFRSLSLVRKELQFFLDHKVPLVKFVDRTFNCNHNHAAAVWKYITEHDNGVTCFHFEVAADLLNEEELSIIGAMRPGLIQLEIGVQSVNLKTIREIRRSMNLEKVKENVRRIREGENVHQHLDLIAGLPYEDIESFRHSFDKVYNMKPDQLQLGFLKVLKGSFMEKNKEEYQLVYQERPPYEVLYTRWITYFNILELKGVEEMVEIYYNSGQFSHTMEALEKEYASAYEMYRELWRFYDKNHYLDMQHKRSARYEILLEFVKSKSRQKEEIFRELLTYDYYLRENAKSRPEFAGRYMVDKEFIKRFYEREEREHIYLPEYRSYDRNQMRKMTHIEYFSILGKMLLFDYKCRNPLNQDARTCMIKRGSQKWED